MTHAVVLPSNRSSTNLQNSKKRHSHHARPVRPALLTRRDTGGQKSPAHSRRPSSSRSSKSAGSRTDDDLDTMTGLFPQYCTVCEKQIAVPDSSILYCSDGCRVKDNCQTSTYQLFQRDVSFVSPSQSPRTSQYYHNSPSSYRADLAERDIIPQRSPTTIHQSLSLTSFSRINSAENMALPLSSSTPRHHAISPRSSPPNSRDSETLRYLAQFQDAPTRALHSRGISSAGPPSLSHTPGSSASATSPIASWASTTPAGNSSFGRPLPRTVPGGSSSTYSIHKSVDLVTPLSVDETRYELAASRGSEDTIVPAMEGLRLRTHSRIASPAADQVIYEKKRISKASPETGMSPSGGGGRLRQMFESEQRGRRRS